MLPIAIGTSGLIYLWAAVRRVRPVVWLLKPGTMALIIWLALTGVRSHPAPGYAYAVAGGLVVSVVGDICLMLPQERFIGGLAAFLAAHFLYIGGLWLGLPVRPVPADLATSALLAVIALLVFRRLAGGLRERGQGKLLVPVGVYAFAITVMVWRAAAVLYQPGAVPVVRWLPALGALLFYVSDMALAWDKFVRPLPLRDVIVMATYFAAQFCFAASVAFLPGA